MTAIPAVSPAEGVGAVGYPEGLPLLSLARESAWRTEPAALADYYADRRQVLRNVTLIVVASVGWNISLQVVTPLMAVHLLDLGVRENIQGTVSSLNFWAVSVLVMLFGWMSDHTISRFGRRKPCLFIAAPFIIGVLLAFPFVAKLKWVALLLTLQGVYLLFMDLKNSTFSLAIIDCVPGPVLGRAMAAVTIIAGLVGFFANRYAGRLLAMGEAVPFLLATGAMTITTAAAAFVTEPPVYHPRTGPFRLWSTFRVTKAHDKRLFVLMAGIALLYAYPTVCTQWMWFWSKETLGLSRGDIFEAVSWAGLANVVLSYPIGWLVDRYGGLKVVLGFTLLCCACFTGLLHVQTKSGLAWLVVAQTVVFPLYWSADMLVYKTCPRQNVGAITATNSCLRNMFLGCLSLVSGWAIFLAGHDYRVGFTLGLVATCAGAALCCTYQWLVRRADARASLRRPVWRAVLPESVLAD